MGPADESSSSSPAAASVAPLLRPEGWALLEALPPYAGPDTAMALGERLRAEGAEAQLVAAAMTQSRLRAKGAAKFGPFADGMLFTAEGLEQATRLQVAAHHAQRFRDAGCSRVADLGCGIGGDAMALASLGLGVLAVDRDEATAAVATVNLRHWPDAQVQRADVLDVISQLPELGGAGGPGRVDRVDGAWLDPARRTASGRRVLDPHHASPPWSAVLDVARRVPATGVKLAPGVPRDIAAGSGLPAEVQWVSVDGDVVEAACWFGPLARPGRAASALVLRSAERGGTATLVDDDDLPVPPAVASPEGVGTYLYDPDGAVVRSGLVGQVAALVGGSLLDPTIAYVTSERLVATPLARAFAVEEVWPFGLKALRTRLRDRGVGAVEVLKRGSAVDVEQLRRSLRLEGPRQATLVLTRVAGRQHVLLCRPAAATRA
ncbi:class I SAM-dependent methyltransferase [Quadrisphaera setariae]|uniref:Class I SAM-dependent methyltransferase n=1 Tax=Quadrisphaera setariae TaxID=2593304 RepID=A0A5C8ZMK2_9ACTN|nr:class I SAM-dependent methyltransferase [Quadrisphaera setariae]